ncbi:hypothetical protein WICPIJ_002275 [Wickerhamomyces pijperi]|uniref:Uncharacterized protein n=1 Tax=Wickerhamomyces pijperi TaxID=599730 RepID=A0A9P8Q9F9_WICPI|nr:hypothetical protein WICPIJ_002275 [Wickerhamomyces pijperi]
MQPIVGAYQLLQLGLNIGDLISWEIVLVQWNLGGFQVSQEPQLGRSQEHQGLTLGLGTSGGTTDSVDVVSWIIRRIELDDPVNRWDIQPSGGNVGTDQDPGLGVTELEERVGTLLLLLLPVKIQHWQINVVQQLGVVLDRVTRGQEHDNLLLDVLLQEGEQQEETLVGLTHNVTLLQSVNGGSFLFGVNIDEQRPRS